MAKLKKLFILLIEWILVGILIVAGIILGMIAIPILIVLGVLLESINSLERLRNKNKSEVIDV